MRKGIHFLATLKTLSRGFALASIVVLLVMLAPPHWDTLNPSVGLSVLQEPGVDPHTSVDVSNGGDCFTKNRGQVEDGVLYYNLGSLSFVFTENGLILAMSGDQGGYAVLLRFEGANLVLPAGVGDVCHETHFLIGERQGWLRHVPSYPSIRFENLYDGIDLLYRIDGGLKSEFAIHPGADPSLIQMRYVGAETLNLDPVGNLVLGTQAGDIMDAHPLAHQSRSPRNEPVGVSYRLNGHVVSFELGAYDLSRLLILDPLIYSTFLGGNQGDSSRNLVIDHLGNVYISGTTKSLDFPTTPGAFAESDPGGFSDAFVAKLNQRGTGLVYATYLGGSGHEFGTDHAVDDAGNVYLVGGTGSADFPVTPDAFDTTYDGGDAFLAKLSSDGADLVYATYLGGSDSDTAWSVALDGSMNALIAGRTSSSDFPVTPGAFDGTYSSRGDSFVAKLSANGSDLLYATYLGGSGVEFAWDLAVSPSGEAYITGNTNSSDFPTTTGAFDETHNGNRDVFVAKLSQEGSSLLYATYLGGLGSDTGRGIAFVSGAAVVTGTTESSDFPTTPGAFDEGHSGGTDAFVVRMNPEGTGIAYATFIGGRYYEGAGAVALDDSENVYVTGWTNSDNFPTTPDAFDETYNDIGIGDAFLVKLSPQGDILVYSSFFGGRRADGGRAIAVDAGGDVYIAGTTSSSDFPTTPGVFDETYNGGDDVFLLRISTEERTTALELLSPFNYASVPPGTSIQLAVSGPGFLDVEYSLDGGTRQTLDPPFELDTASWSFGMHVLQVQVSNETGIALSKDFVFFVDPTAAWPPDAVHVDVVLIGFNLPSSEFLAELRTAHDVTTALNKDGVSTFQLRFDFEVHSAGEAYHEALLEYLQSKSVYRDTLQARLNLMALVDQRENGTPRDIFDPLVGHEIQTAWVELYLEQFPPFPKTAAEAHTFYLLNLSALDDPSADADHWFVEPSLEPDALVNQDWWRLEWDNELNTPMGYPLNAWGGPDHKVFVDPTAYQWFLDWTYVWWEGGTGRAPYGLQYEEVPPAARASYLGEIVNDLVTGLAATLPNLPPVEPAIEIRNYVLSGSLNHSIDDLEWVISGLSLADYLGTFLPFKQWRINTTFANIASYPEIMEVVDANTMFEGDRGFIDGLAVWNHLFENKELYVVDDPDTFEVLTVSIFYDNRSMVLGGREFTGLGESGVTAIFLDTDRLYYADGRRQKGLTSIISHETGHNLGYAHQFGPSYRADFVDGNMGYFRRHLGYGTFWEDAMHRVYLREKLFGILDALDSREPVDLGPEFTSFYRSYLELDFSGAYEALALIAAMLVDEVPPSADAGPDLTVDEDAPHTLDASASSDNFRIVSYTWDFGDGTTAGGSEPTVEKAWTQPGTYTVSLTVTDAAGNRDVSTLTAAVVDVTRPMLDILSPAPGSDLGSPDVQVVWSGSDEGVGLDRFELTIDGGRAIVLAEIARSYNLSALQDGDHVVMVTAFDKAGNSVSQSVTFSVVTSFFSPTKPYALLVLVSAAVLGASLGLYLYWWRGRRRARKKQHQN